MGTVPHIISPIFGLLLNVVTQLLICRYVKRVGLLKSVFAGFVFGFISVVIIEANFFLTETLLAAAFVGRVSLNLITYAALGYCYFHFINLGETARRIRILRELWDSDDGLTMDEIRERYNASEIILARLERMMGNHQIVLKENRYYIGKPVLLYMAKALVFMKIILLGRRNEFD